MRARLAFVALAVLGVLLAGSVGYAAYLASRDSVGLPVTRLDEKPRELAPTTARKRARAARKRPVTTVEDRGRTSTGPRVDDRSGRGGSGSGSSGSGSGSGSSNSGPGSSGSGSGSGSGGSNSGPGGGGGDD